MAAVLGHHDVVDDVQAKTRAYAWRLGCIERIEDTLPALWRYTRSRVLDLDEHALLLGQRPDSEHSLPFHGVDCVVDEVCPYLVELAAVRLDERDIAVLPSYLDTFLELVLQDDERGIETFAEIHFLHGSLVEIGVRLDAFHN